MVDFLYGLRWGLEGVWFGGGGVAGYNFIGPDRDQLFLLPPSLQDWLPGDDLAYLVIDAVAQMEMGPFHAAYRADGAGQAAYQPQMMVALLLYAYCVGVRSSRQIERLCVRDVAFRVVAGNTRPDHSTIARFRTRHRESLTGLFTESLKLCAKAGLVKLGLVALDGTKIAANASLEANLSYASIREQVDAMMADAEAQDAAENLQFGEDRRGDEMPTEMADPTSRKARLTACKRQLEEEAKERTADQKKAFDAYTQSERETGKRRVGRPPKPVSSEPEANAQANVTDPQSRIMKTRRGYVQGYNAQAVANEHQIVLAAEVTQDRNDYGQLVPMTQIVARELAAAGLTDTIETLLADAGYADEDSFAQEPADGPQWLVALSRDDKPPGTIKKSKAPRAEMGSHLEGRKRMQERLEMERGQTLYRQRKQIIEPIFGQIKSARRIDRFQQRGLSNCQAEWKLICTTHNLLKLWRSGKAEWN